MADSRSVIKVIELFAGAGGLGIGFLLADHGRVRYEPMFAVDTDEDAVESYKQNMRWLNEHAPAVLPYVPKVYKKSVDKLTVRSIFRAYRMRSRDLDLLIGGPPCQGYSPSNRQTVKERKNELNNMVKVFMDQVQGLSPKMFLIENVQGVQWTAPTDEMDVDAVQLPLFSTEASKSKDVRDYIISRATQLGYKVWHNILDAADYGVPQKRMRFFFFGVHEEFAKDFDISLMPYLRHKKVSERVTVNQAISDLPVIGNGQKWSGDSYQPSNNAYVNYLRKYIAQNTLYDHHTTNHQQHIIERFMQIAEGQNWEAIRHLMNTYSDVDRTHSNIYRRLVGNAPAHTISHYRKSMTIHPQQHRGLSFREACRLQSFPDWCRFTGGSDSAQQQLANAVPPLLASAIAWAIAEVWAKIVGLENEDVTDCSHVQEDFFDLLLETAEEIGFLLTENGVLEILQDEELQTAQSS